MHLAICDDSMADRKQAERLVGRESDKWIAKGDPIYSFSFGSADSLLASTISYDAILIDISHTEGRNTLEVINLLRKRGVHSAIIVCDPMLNADSEGLPDNILFLPKPVKVSELHDIFEKVKDIVAHYEKQIELRGEKFTMYITEKELMYAVQSGTHSTKVYLTNERTVVVNSNVNNLFDDIEAKHPTFVMANPATIINVRFIDSFKLRRAVLKDGFKVKVAKYAAKYTKEMIEALDKENASNYSF